MVVAIAMSYLKIILRSYFMVVMGTAVNIIVFSLLLSKHAVHNTYTTVPTIKSASTQGKRRREVKAVFVKTGLAFEPINVEVLHAAGGLNPHDFLGRDTVSGFVPSVTVVDFTRTRSEDESS